MNVASVVVISVVVVLLLVSVAYSWKKRKNKCDGNCNRCALQSYDKENKKAVIKASICTGEQVAGFKDIHTGHFDEIMLIRNEADLEAFMEMYGVTAISKEY